MIFNWFCEAVFYGVGCKFFLKSAKHFIPYDKAHAHIFVEIADVTGVVNPVMAGAYKESLKPAGHFVNVFCVYQYAVGLCDGIHKNNIYGMKTHEYNRDKINETVYRLKYR